MTPRGGQFGPSWLAAKARGGVLISNSPRLIAFEDCNGNKSVHRQSLGIPPESIHGLFGYRGVAGCDDGIDNGSEEDGGDDVMGAMFHYGAM